MNPNTNAPVTQAQEAIDRVRAKLASGHTGPEDSTGRSRARRLDQILADPKALEDPEIVAPKIAWRGRVTLLASREKVGKSTLLGVIAAKVSAGERFLGGNLTPSRVLLVGLEEHPFDMAKRLVEHGADQTKVYILSEVGEDPIMDILDAVEEYHPHLVIVDTLPKLAETLVQDGGSAAQWTPVMSDLTKIARDSNAAVVLLHHCRKSDNSYRDSTAVGAGVDVIITMDTVSDDPSVRTFTTKARWRSDDFSLRLTDEGYVLASGELTLETRVVFYVQGNPRCSTNAVRKAVSGKATDIDTTLERLAKRGAIDDVGKDGRHEWISRGPKSRDEVRDDPPSSELSRLGPTTDEAGTNPGTAPSSHFQTPRVEIGTTPQPVAADEVWEVSQ